MDEIALLQRLDDVADVDPATLRRPGRRYAPTSRRQLSATCRYGNCGRHRGSARDG